MRVSSGGGVAAAALFLAELGLYLVEAEGRHRLAQVIEPFADGAGLRGRPGGGVGGGGGPGGGGGGVVSWSASAALAGPLFVALAGFLDAVGFAFDGDDLGIVGQAVDQRDDAGGVGEHLFPF